jgi:hypothetical protein
MYVYMYVCMYVSRMGTVHYIGVGVKVLSESRVTVCYMSGMVRCWLLIYCPKHNERHTNAVVGSVDRCFSIPISTVPVDR